MANSTRDRAYFTSGVFRESTTPQDLPRQRFVTFAPVTGAEPHGAIRILIVDDHGLVRDSLSASLGCVSDFCVVGEASNANEAIRKVFDLNPDVVLMDIDMPGLSCFDAIQIIHSRSPKTKVILLTAYEHDEHLEQAICVKANGFVSKSEGIAVLTRAIYAVVSGLVHYSPAAMKRLVVDGDDIRLANPPKTRLHTLSPRERELLRVLAQGVSLKEASQVLGICYKTADKQKASLMTKLDIHDRVELARFAIREGLVEP